MNSIERAIQKQKDNIMINKGQDNQPNINKLNNSSETGGGKRQINKINSVQDILLDQGFISQGIKGSRQIDEYRLIKRPLLINAFSNNTERDERANVVMITSAIAGEGKTYTVLNLAMSMAMERDTTVLVIDCDNARSSLSRALGLGNEPGLTDLLLGKIKDIDGVIVNTDIPKLKVISSGETNEYTTELFASERMESLLSEIAHRYTDRIILLDTPPLLQASQTKVLAHYVGQILVVVEEGKTEQTAVVEAINQLDPKKIIGTILNKRSYSSNSEYYGGYYGKPDA